MLPPHFLQRGAIGRPLFKLFAALLIAGAGYLAFLVGPDLMAAKRAGFFEKTDPKAYVGTSNDNLKAIHTALMLYHNSEERFPDATGWMDAIKPLLNTADLKPGEAVKKLHHPARSIGEFGYGLNIACAGKYKDDVPGKENTILVYESSDGIWNAHGQPSGRGITIGGKILEPNSK